jgi:hypothetical protein
MALVVDHDHNLTRLSHNADICPLCGSKISRTEFIKIQERIRVEEAKKLESQRQALESEKQSLKVEFEQKQLHLIEERDHQLATRETEVRRELAEQAAKEREAQLRQYAQQIDAARVEAQRDEEKKYKQEREGLQSQVEQLETKVSSVLMQKESEQETLTSKIAHQEGELAKALARIRQFETTATETKNKIEKEISHRYEVMLVQKQQEIEREQMDKETVLARLKETAMENEAALKNVKLEYERQINDTRAATTAALLEQRQVLENDHKLQLLEKHMEQERERERWQKKIVEFERQMQNKTPNELGDFTQIHVLDALRNVYPDDRITPIAKGAPGADIRQEVIHNGKICGKILLDSKNHKAWRYEFIRKLKEDQIVERAEYGILVTNEFPKGQKELCIEEGIIVTSPGRVVAVIEVLRSVLQQMHVLRLSTHEREQKTQEVYELITSEKFQQQLDKLNRTAGKFEELDIEETQTHQRMWKKRGQLIRALKDVHLEIHGSIVSIIEGER